MGLLHGIYCLGCCWLSFVISFFPLGINIGAMAAVTLIILAEENAALAPAHASRRGCRACALRCAGDCVIATPPHLQERWQHRYARRNADEDAREWQRTCHEGNRTSTLRANSHLADMHSIVVVATHSRRSRPPMLCFNRAGRVVWFAPFPTRPHPVSPAARLGASAVLGGQNSTHVMSASVRLALKADMTLKYA